MGRKRILPAPDTKSENKSENRIHALRMELYTKKAALRFEYELKRDALLREHGNKEITQSERIKKESESTEQYKKEEDLLIQEHENKIKEMAEHDDYNSDDEYFSLKRELISARLRSRSKHYYIQYAEMTNSKKRENRKSLKAFLEK